MKDSGFVSLFFYYYYYYSLNVKALEKDSLTNYGRSSHHAVDVLLSCLASWFTPKPLRLLENCFNLSDNIVAAVPLYDKDPESHM